MSGVLRLLLMPLIGGLMLVSISLMALAQQQPQHHPAMVGFLGTCDGTPCWQGVQPGQTTLDEVRTYLLGAGYEAGIINDTQRFHYYYSDHLTPGCVKVGYLPDSTTVSFLRLYCIEHITLGDALSLLGTPQAISYRFSIYGDAEYLIFNRAQRLTGITLMVGSGWDSAYRPIASIDIFDARLYARAHLVFGGWYGFLPGWRYCQLEPAYPRCR